MSDRAALLIRCTKDQATKARESAESERRTVSGYVLTVVMRAVSFEERYLARVERPGSFSISRPPGPRTCLLIRCSAQEAKRIRAAAKHREMTMCGYVLYCLERAWARGAAPGASRK